MDRPDYLVQGEAARLFPVLSTTSKEGRTTSIVLACMDKVEEFGAELLGSIGQRVGKRSKLGTFTEIVFKDEKDNLRDRPDGLIVLTTGSREWRALVEAKIGNAELCADQIERYRSLAKQNGIDCIITLSNHFATAPTNHPLEDVRKSRSKIPVFHWSWMYVLTTADLLLSGDDVADIDQQILLNELVRFLTHESAGIKGFDRMPPEWSELNRLVSAGGRIQVKSHEAEVVLDAWHQETRDLSLILSRQTETMVCEKLPRKHLGDPTERKKDEMISLRDSNRLTAILQVPNAASPLEIVVDIARRTIDVGMTLRAPEDKKSSRARVNWLLRQIKVDPSDEVHVRLNWPGRSEATQFPLKGLIEDPTICEQDKSGLQVLSFHLYIARRLGSKFTQQVNFIKELEEVVPQYYREIGQNLSEWRRPAPKIKPNRDVASDVSPEGLAEDADDKSLEIE
ncbi:hypothetical protein [Roseovarius pelagicus]|uniref:PD-(D/E)XK nuclease superfamily protein n=1 Tax=Roseovarius pelagicus TaxID=2980108 RepID=A0ABY6DDZ2_9RHOB|nr:hypothetical protein [Roseovarius pelagicus]UXX84372.1 hypothetical protein N7U68_06930 [Roseovarius pelagicus]